MEKTMRSHVCTCTIHEIFDCSWRPQKVCKLGFKPPENCICKARIEIRGLVGRYGLPERPSAAANLLRPFGKFKGIRFPGNGGQTVTWKVRTIATYFPCFCYIGVRWWWWRSTSVEGLHASPPTAQHSARGGATTAPPSPSQPPPGVDTSRK